jgi:hypothetical protein
MERGYGSFILWRFPTDGKSAQNWASKHVEIMMTLAEPINVLF